MLQLEAQEKYSLKIAYGESSQNDMGEILSGNRGAHEESLYVVALDGGYLLKENMMDLPLDIYLKSALAYFDESQYDAVYEIAIFIKAYWNFDFLDNRIRLGLGEGLSYTSSILRAEYLEALAKSDNNSQFLNYIEISADFDIGKLIRTQALNDTYIGWALKHRSGIYGLINNVRHGGSNYNTLYIERKF